MLKRKGLDYFVANHGSLFLFTPLNRRAERHLKAHVASDAQWMGNALAVEHRYALPLAEQLQSDGFAV